MSTLRITACVEPAPGVVPDPLAMAGVSVTEDTCAYEPVYADSQTLNEDGTTADAAKVDEKASVAYTFEFRGLAADPIAAAALAAVVRGTWDRTPVRASGAVSAVDATAGTVAVASGAAFVAGQLVRFAGFGVGANAGVRRVSAGSATAPVFAASGLADEPTPPAGARLKVVGARGAAGDIQATASGLSSTALDFLAVGVRSGAWIKIGSAGGQNYSFGITENNAFARVAAAAAHELTLDTLPAGWTADAGASKEIAIWFGDGLTNGQSLQTLLYERMITTESGTFPVSYHGVAIDKFSFDIKTGGIIGCKIASTAMRGVMRTATLDAAPSAAPTGAPWRGTYNVGTFSLLGDRSSGPNWSDKCTIDIARPAEPVPALGHTGGVGQRNKGALTVSGSVDTVFADDTYYAAVISGERSSLSVILNSENEALAIQVPRITFPQGAPKGGAGNDATLSLQYRASRDPTMGVQVRFDHLEYHE